MSAALPIQLSAPSRGQSLAVGTNGRAFNSWRERWVHELPNVTGSGTSSDPYVGWDAALNASVTGQTWHFSQAYFRAANAEIVFQKSDLTLQGVNGTVIQSTVTGADHATFRFYPPISDAPNNQSYRCYVRDITFDGRGLTPICVAGDVMVECGFNRLRVKNYTSYGFKIQHFDQCWIDGLQMVAYDMTTVTPNGILLGYLYHAGETSGDPIGAYQCDVRNCWFSNLTGTAIEIPMGLGNRIVSGQADVCGIGFKFGSETQRFTVECFDHEETTGTGPVIDGFGHTIRNCNGTASTVTVNGVGVSVGGGNHQAGGHVFERCVGAIVYNANAYSRAEDVFNVGFAGTHPEKLVVVTNGGMARATASGVTTLVDSVAGTRHTESADANGGAGPMAQEWRQGNDNAYGLDCGVNWTGGDWVWYYVAANVRTEFMRWARLNGLVTFQKDVTINGLLTVKPPVTLIADDTSTMKLMQWRQSNASDYGFDFGLEFASGDLVMYSIAAGVRTIITRWSRVNAGFFIANTGSVPGTPTGGGVLYVQSGALKYKGSSGTVTTLGVA